MSNGLVELELVIGAINLFTFRDIDTNVKNAKRIKRLALPLADDVGSSILGAFIASERSNKVLQRGTIEAKDSMKLLRLNKIWYVKLGTNDTNCFSREN